MDQLIDSHFSVTLQKIGSIMLKQEMRELPVAQYDF